MKYKIISTEKDSCIIKFTAENNEKLNNNRKRIVAIVNKINNKRLIYKLREFGDDKELCVAVIYDN